MCRPKNALTLLIPVCRTPANIAVYFDARVVRPCRYHDSLFFFFNDPAPPEIYTLSLHDALPIYLRTRVGELGAIGLASCPPLNDCSIHPVLPDGRALGQEALTHSGRPQPQNSSSGHAKPPFATRVVRFVPVLDSSEPGWPAAVRSDLHCDEHCGTVVRQPSRRIVPTPGEDSQRPARRV